MVAVEVQTAQALHYAPAAVVAVLLALDKLVTLPDKVVLVVLVVVVVQQPPLL
jgi:hypothetical protein